MEVTCEGYPEGHGPENMVKIHCGPPWGMWKMCNRVNAIPDGIKVVALVGVDEGHGADEVGIVKVVPKQGDSVVLGVLGWDGSWEQGVGKTWLSKVPNQV